VGVVANTRSLTKRELRDLCTHYRVGVDDTLMIALNAFGARSANGFPRARMMLRLRSRPDDPLRLGIPLARDDSPFVVVDDVLYFDGDPIADLEFLEHDDALLGYFRKRGRVLILNSNARSGCTGCVFCPNTLEGASDPRLAVLDDLSTCFSMFEAEMGWPDLAHLEEVNLVTGCFHEEQPALEHMELVRSALESHRSRPVLGILSSVIRTREALERSAETLAPFMLVVTLECFTNREAILKHSKAELRPEDVPAILATAKELGHETGFTYIVGLEPIHEVIDQIEALAAHCTRFPNLQVYQAHNRFMERFAAPGADDLEYYLSARKDLERIFYDTELRPLTWTNYRPLWYFEFADEALAGDRI
jgi:hypothetical protein